MFRKTATGVLFFLFGLSSTLAATFTVGTGGTHATIQAAITAAITAGGDSEIRVEAGTYTENLTVADTMTSGTLTITGGWDPAFTIRNTDPSVTTISGGSVGRVLTVEILGGTLTLDGFTLKDGNPAFSFGGELSLEPRNAAQITISNNQIQGNTITATGGVDGGGVYAWLRDSTQLCLTDNRISGNSVQSTGSTTSGAGCEIIPQDSSAFTIRDNIIESNQTINSTNQSTGVGVRLFISDSASGDFSDNVIRGNNANGSGGQVGSGGAIWISNGSGTVTAQRNLWLDNQNNVSDFSQQVSLIADMTSTLLFTDSVVAGGNQAGLIRVTPGTIARCESPT